MTRIELRTTRYLVPEAAHNANCDADCPGYGTVLNNHVAKKLVIQRKTSRKILSYIFPFIKNHLKMGLFLMMKKKNSFNFLKRF